MDITKPGKPGHVRAGRDLGHMWKHTARNECTEAGPIEEMIPVINGWRFVLATDLDGTFLGGSDDDRLRLYRWIEERRPELGLVFVTGRDPKFIETLCAETPVPYPDFVVGDVGTTIAKMSPTGPGGEIRPIQELEEEIAALWGDSGPKVREALHGHPGLTLQPTDFRFRVSYDYDPESFDPAAERIVTEMGLDYLISAGRFFDVLPKGVSKGPSLVRLARRLGIPSERVLVAGDTLNDYSMFETDFHGVAVGNSEAALLERLEGDGRVFRAGGHGAAGIMDAIAHFGLHESAPR
jgi:hydroxymethylpyrimidine pyrophosphatase-like HAD family hydrolase